MKRILCTLLVLSMLLSAMPAFAKDYLETYKYMDQIFRFDVGDFVTGSGDDAAAGGVDTEQEMINFLDFVGVWDNAEAKKNAHITQTEFSIIMSKLKLGSENALIDVYLANPDDTKVTYQDAYKQIITALGYYHICERYDNPEDWIIFVADEIDLLVSVPNNMNEYITRAELAKIITKALNIDLSVIEYTSDGHRYNVAEGKTLLNSVHNLHDISGFVNAIYGLSVYSGNDCREGYIQINRRNIKTSGLDLDHYLGRMVRAYASYDELRNEYSVVYIDYDTDAKYLEINFADIADVTNDRIYYYDENGEEKELSISGLKNISENGKQLNSISEMSDFAENEGKIILTSSEKYGDIDTAVIYKYIYALVEYNDTLINRIGFKNYQKYNGTDTFVTVDENAVKKVTLNGEAIELSALPAGVTARLFKNEQTGYMEIIATNEKLVGQVTSIDGDMYAIDDNWYRISKDFKKVLSDTTIPASKQLKPLELGLSTTFYVLDGVIIAYAKASEYKYGYLKSVTQTRSAIDPDITLRIFSQDGEWIDLKVTKPIEFDGEKNVEKADVYNAIATESREAERTVETKIIGNLIRYKASGDMLTGLDTVNESRFETNTDDDLDYNRFNTLDGNWTNDWLDLSYPYMITENTVLFAIPKESDNEDLYSMTNNTAISGIAGQEGTMPSHFFNTNELCEVGVVLIEGTINDIKGNQSSGSGSDYYVKRVMNAVIDADNQEFGYKIVAEKLSTGTALGVAYAPAPGSFYVTKQMFDKNPIAVGDFINATVSGGKASSYNITLPGGLVPEEVSYKTTSTTGFVATGYLAAFDAATDRAVLLIEDENGDALVNENNNKIEKRHPIVCRAKIIINPDKKEMISTTLSGFHVGDKVYTRVGYGRAAYIVKNVFDN